MTAFERWRLAARAQLNALLDRTADTGPARAALLSDARKVVAEALAASRRNVAGLVAEVARLREDATRAENAAMAALKLADEAAARDRLAEKLRLDRERADAQTALDAARAEVKALEEDLAAFEARVGGAGATGGTAQRDALADLKRKLDD
jgi:phage shock protein A